MSAFEQIDFRFSNLFWLVSYKVLLIRLEPHEKG